MKRVAVVAALVFALSAATCAPAAVDTGRCVEQYPNSDYDPIGGNNGGWWSAKGKRYGWTEQEDSTCIHPWSPIV